MNTNEAIRECIEEVGDPLFEHIERHCAKYGISEAEVRLKLREMVQRNEVHMKDDDIDYDFSYRKGNNWVEAMTELSKAQLEQLWQEAEKKVATLTAEVERLKKKKTGKPLSLLFIWNTRLKLWAEGDKLWAEGNKLYADADKLRAESDKLYAEGNKLYAEGDKLRAGSNKLWAEAIIEVHGNIKLEWRSNGDCVLETGEVFKVKP